MQEAAKVNLMMKPMTSLRRGSMPPDDCDENEDHQHHETGAPGVETSLTGRNAAGPAATECAGGGFLASCVGVTAQPSPSPSLQKRSSKTADSLTLLAERFRQSPFPQHRRSSPGWDGMEAKGFGGKHLPTAGSGQQHGQEDEEDIGEGQEGEVLEAAPSPRPPTCSSPGHGPSFVRSKQQVAVSLAPQSVGLRGALGLGLPSLSKDSRLGRAPILA